MRRSAYFDWHAHFPEVSLVEVLTVPAVQAGQRHASGKGPIQQGTMLDYSTGQGRSRVGGGEQGQGQTGLLQSPANMTQLEGLRPQPQPPLSVKHHIMLSLDCTSHVVECLL